jgi:predicted DNA-binding protein with PD1-like motif
VKEKLLNEESGQKTFAVVFETGDEVASGLLAFAKEKSLAGSHFTAIGALSDVTLGFFDWDKKDYLKLQINEQVEVLSLIGDIALNKGEPKVHGHIVVSKSDGTAHGGHLIEAHVRPTLEVILVESPQHLVRRFDEETRLALIDLDAEQQ